MAIVSLRSREFGYGVRYYLKMDYVFPFYMFVWSGTTLASLVAVYYCSPYKDPPISLVYAEIYVIFWRGGDLPYHNSIIRCLHYSVGPYVTVFLEWSKTQLIPVLHLISHLIHRLLLDFTNGIVVGGCGLILLIFQSHAKATVLDSVVDGGFAPAVCVVVAVTYRPCLALLRHFWFSR